ncbi:MAG: polysaccharide biosynthesis C-terminal domain-containing protein, partial [Bacillota bacterium]|nr:polysaccharide biosynthesis C-terminal domain-containing protein [Bacillota bacterium]
LKVSAVIGLPCCFGLYFLSYPVLELIFPGHSDGYMILKYLSLSIPFVIIVQTTTSILQGIGSYMKPVRNLFIGCVIKIILTLILVPMKDINIYGAVAGSICGYIVTSVMNLHILKKNLESKINWYEILIKPAYSAILMIILVVIIYNNVYNFTGSIRISCVLSILAGVLAYVILILLFGTFKYDDIKKKIIKR